MYFETRLQRILLPGAYGSVGSIASLRSRVGLTMGRGGLPLPCDVAEGLTKGAVLPDVEGADVFGIELVGLPLPGP